MGSLFPILGTLFQSASFTLDKAILSLKRTSYKTYVGLSFPLLFCFDLIIFLIFRPPVPFAALTGTILLILLASIALALVGNIFYYRALEKDTLTELQTLGLLTRFPAIIFAFLAFPDERNVWTIALALAASLAIAWSHWDHNRLEIKRDTLWYLIWFLFVIPFGAILSKILLGVFNPIVLMLFQDGSIALILGWLYLKESVKITRRAVPFLLLTNLFSSIGWILYFTSYQQFGIIYTALLFSLQPLLTYFASVVFLKESLDRRKVLAFLIVLISVAFAQAAHGF